MFYTIVFSLLGVLLVVAVVTVLRRNKTELATEDRHGTARHPTTHPDTARKQRKAKRAQSRHDRRKRR